MPSIGKRVTAHSSGGNLKELVSSSYVASIVSNGNPSLHKLVPQRRREGLLMTGYAVTVVGSKPSSLATAKSASGIVFASVTLVSPLPHTND